MIEHTHKALLELAADYARAGDAENPYVLYPLRVLAGETCRDLVALADWVASRRNRGDEMITAAMLFVPQQFGETVAGVAEMLRVLRNDIPDADPTSVVSQLGWAVDHLGDVVARMFPDLFIEEAPKPKEAPENAEREVPND